MSGAVPPATTAKLAVEPTLTLWLAGCVVTVGDVVAAVTVNVAELLVTSPALFMITTEYSDPLSATTVAGVVKLAIVAPEITVPFLRH